MPTPSRPGRQQAAAARSALRGGQVHRQTIALPSPTARRVKALARERRQSTSRVLADLVEAGLSQRQREREEFLALLESYRQASAPAEREQLGEQLGRMLFGR